MKRVLNTILACVAPVLASASSFGQDLVHKAPPQDRPIAIVNATIHTVSGGTIERGFIAFDEGRIVEVGAGDRVFTARHRIIDAAGKHVYPGLVSANSTLGLMEINAVRQTVDAREAGDITPEAIAAVAVNPDSTIIPVTRSNGVLVAVTLPEGGTIPGRASVLQLDGWTWEDMAVRADAGLVVNWPNVRPVRAWWSTRSDEEQAAEIKRNLEAIEGAFADAEAYLAARASDASIGVDIRREAFRGALEKTSPVFIRAQELEQIQSAVSWAAKRGLRTVIIGGRDAAMCAELLRKHNATVVVTGTHRLPRRDDSAYDEAYTLPAQLEQAGVKWCLATVGGTFETPHTRNLPYHAATAVAHGLPRDVALRAITLSAAEALGVADRVGSLEAGKDATLMITDGDPLEFATKIDAAFIGGREIDLTDKHKALAEKYREKYRQKGLIPREQE